MRDYLTTRNFAAAAGLGLLAALLSLPRLITAGTNVMFFFPAAWVSMTLIGGAATAWGKNIGRAQLWIEPERLQMGFAIVICSATALAVFRTVFADPAMLNAINHSPAAMPSRNIHLPRQPGMIIALMLWAASFETVFFRAGSICFFGRLTGRKNLSIFMAALLRTWVSAFQMNSLDIAAPMPCLLLSAVQSITAGTVFVYFGLVPAAVFSALIEARLLFL